MVQEKSELQLGRMQLFWFIAGVQYNGTKPLYISSAVEATEGTLTAVIKCTVCTEGKCVLFASCFSAGRRFIAYKLP